jgi:single-strand DNA-binding protein
MDSWDDKTTGEKRSKLKVEAERVQFLDRRDDPGGGEGDFAPPREREAPPRRSGPSNESRGPSNGTPRNVDRPSGPVPRPSAPEPEASSEEDEDIPF